MQTRIIENIGAIRAITIQMSHQEAREILREGILKIAGLDDPSKPEAFNLIHREIESLKKSIDGFSLPEYDKNIVASIFEKLKVPLQDQIIQKPAKTAATWREHSLRLQQTLLGHHEIESKFQDTLKKIAKKGKEYPSHYRIYILACSTYVPYLQWVNPFVKSLSTHLQAAGLSSITISTEDECFRTFQSIESSTTLIIGTEVLLQKHKAAETAIASQLGHVARARRLGRTILPLLMSGDVESSFPVEYENIPCQIWNAETSYFNNLQQLVASLYSHNNKDYLSRHAEFKLIWDEFLSAIKPKYRTILENGYTEDEIRNYIQSDMKADDAKKSAHRNNSREVLNSLSSSSSSYSQMNHFALPKPAQPKVEVNAEDEEMAAALAVSKKDFEESKQHRALVKPKENKPVIKAKLDVSIDDDEQMNLALALSLAEADKFSKQPPQPKKPKVDKELAPVNIAKVEPLPKPQDKNPLNEAKLTTLWDGTKVDLSPFSKNVRSYLKDFKETSSPAYKINALIKEFKLTQDEQDVLSDETFAGWQSSISAESQWLRLPVLVQGSFVEFGEIIQYLGKLNPMNNEEFELHEIQEIRKYLVDVFDPLIAKTRAHYQNIRNSQQLEKKEPSVPSTQAKITQVMAVINNNAPKKSIDTLPDIGDLNNYFGKDLNIIEAVKEDDSTIPKQQICFILVLKKGCIHPSVLNKYIMNIMLDRTPKDELNGFWYTEGSSPAVHIPRRLIEAIKNCFETKPTRSLNDFKKDYDWRGEKVQSISLIGSQVASKQEMSVDGQTSDIYEDEDLYAELSRMAEENTLIKKSYH